MRYLSSVQLLGTDLITGNITEFFRKLVLDTVATREREGIVRPDMLQLLIEAKKGSLHDENTAENQKSTKISTLQQLFTFLQLDKLQVRSLHTELVQLRCRIVRKTSL